MNITGKLLNLRLLLCLLVSGVLVACQDDAATTSPLPTAPKGAVRPVGTPTGQALTQEVGPDGASLEMIDGRIRVDIPAGALAETVSIGIQEIENTSNAGIGKSFRLTPHGQQFSKPVEISFSYEGLEDEITSTYGLGIAFQGEDGVWNYVAEPVVDEESKTITIQSTHFSDWALIEWLLLLPMEPSVAVGGQVTLKAVSFLPVNELGTNLLAPLMPAEKMVGLIEPVDLSAKFIGKWELAGAGVLAPNKNTAVYTAPAAIPEVNPVAVSLHLNTTEGKLVLASHITIVENGIQMRINGGEWIQLEGGLVELEPGYYAIASVTNGCQFNLHWTGGKGQHPYTEDADLETIFQYWEPGLARAYTNWYDTEDDFGLTSGGGINVSSMGETDGWITGTFSASPSGIIDRISGEQVGTATIEGRFKVRKLAGQ